MPFVLVLAAPLALVGAVVFFLRRGNEERAAAERPSIEAAQRIARCLSGEREEARGLAVAAEVEGTRVVCTVSRGAPLVSIEIASTVSLPPILISRHAIGGRELADYAGAEVVLATDGVAESIVGTRSVAWLPEGLRTAMERVGASWITLTPSTVCFTGVPAPTTDEAWPIFDARLRHALALSGVIQAGVLARGSPGA